ncbi:vesicular glutamate transporter 1-like [Phlebotomus papatasi]|uniref:vesicular glutamate transporter 1-like n=1 Tax=Phlebotomus papatasi TaxID=29031 RepID=UPI0024845888|nr:vesicular glutamate transporter 1-like [Phlebotomus papatasi]
MDRDRLKNTSERFELSVQDEIPQNRNAAYTETSSNKYQLSWKVWKFRRSIVTFMGFLGFFTIYAVRVSLSVAIVAMTQKINVTSENSTIVEEQEFNWDSTEQGLLLSSFAYGYIWTQLLGGILAAKYGGHIRDPGSDPRISLEERNYIESNLERRNPNNVRRPWKAIFTSSAVYAHMTANFCDSWTNYTFTSQIPTFLSDVLKYNLGTTGMLAAAPYLVYIIVAVVVSTLSDYIRSKKVLSTQKVRKIMIGSGFIISGSFLVLMSNLVNIVAVFICLIIAISATALTRTYFSNPLDIAPNHASLVMGISNTVGVISGILAPMTAGLIAQNGTQDEWRVIFYISVGFCVIGCMVFAIFGKGSIQKWAESDTLSLPKCSETIKATKVTET